MKALSLVLVGVMGGCMPGVAAATGPQLTRRAAFDLACPASALRYERIDQRSQGVMGCDKHATYVESCDGARERADTICTWVLNGSIEAAPSSASPPGVPAVPGAPSGTAPGAASPAPDPAAQQ